MLQTIHGVTLYVIDFDTMPELPIPWSTEEEKPYAIALDTAIRTGRITEPGKYGITIDQSDPYYPSYNIWSIKD